MLYVVYLLTPTSNHNYCLALLISLIVVYLLTPTSNHNYDAVEAKLAQVVYLLTPTSNHNCGRWCNLVGKLYIFWLLHQTTTLLLCLLLFCRCISFDSYIKPQRGALRVAAIAVVYILTPTSNHNCSLHHSRTIGLYIFWLLHQTTTFLIYKTA